MTEDVQTNSLDVQLARHLDTFIVDVLRALERPADRDVRDRYNLSRYDRPRVVFSPAFRHEILERETGTPVPFNQIRQAIRFAADIFLGDALQPPEPERSDTLVRFWGNQFGIRLKDADALETIKTGNVAAAVFRECLPSGDERGRLFRYQIALDEGQWNFTIVPGKASGLAGLFGSLARPARLVNAFRSREIPSASQDMIRQTARNLGNLHRTLPALFNAPAAAESGIPVPGSAERLGYGTYPRWSVAHEADSAPQMRIARSGPRLPVACILLAHWLTMEGRDIADPSPGARLPVSLEKSGFMVQLEKTRDAPLFKGMFAPELRQLLLADAARDYIVYLHSRTAQRTYAPEERADLIGELRSTYLSAGTHAPGPPEGPRP